jgi:hypothetical protein
MKKLAALTLSLFLTTGTAFADSPKDAPKGTDAQPAKAAAPAKPEVKTAEKTSAEIAAQIEELRQALQAQQEQLQMLKEELSKRDKQIEEAREAAASANAKASDATVKASEAATTSAELKSTTSTLNTTVNSLAASNAAAVSGSTTAASGQGAGTEEKGPTTIRFKGVNLTPGGFMEAATVNRTKAASADINTPFTGIPYNGNSLSRLTEMNFTARQSRISLLADTKLADVKLSSYLEADFLGTGVTSNNRQSNSYVLRYRQYWGNATFADGWSVTGGQQWSLATENKKGIVNRAEALPMMIDPQYIVGFTWQRADSVRVVKNFEDKVAIGFSIENPQTTVGGRGFSSYTNTSATGVVTTFQNFFADAPGAGGGLYNFVDTSGYTVNKLPDFMVKLAVDPGWGHYEVFGIFSDFRSRVYPCAVAGTTAKNFPTPATPTVLACPVDGTTAPSVAGAYNDSRFAGGMGASATVPVFKKLDAGLKVVAGDGIGRYGSAQIADVTARPDGTLAPIRTLHYLAKLEWHPSPKFDVYGYWGSEFGARAAYTGYKSVKITNTPAIPGCGGVGQQPCAGGGVQPAYPALVATSISTTGIGGYGSPYANNTGCGLETLPVATGTPGTGGTCAGDVRMISEGTLGFWHKLYQGEKGRVQWGIQYSYIYKLGWSGNNTAFTATTQPAGISPKAVDNMIFTSLRFYLP